MDRLGHDQRLPSGLEVAGGPRIVEPAIEPYALDFDARGDDPAPERSDHLVRWWSAGDGNDGECEPQSVADDKGGGGGVEVRGPALGFSTKNLVGVRQRLAVVGVAERGRRPERGSVVRRRRTVR